MSVKLDSIILFVKQVELLKKFYVDVFNFEVMEQEAEWVLLSAGSCSIGLHKVGEHYSDPNQVQFESNTKLVFETDNIAALRDALLLQHAHIGELKTFDNYHYWICDGADPEGNIFQLKQQK